MKTYFNLYKIILFAAFLLLAAGSQAQTVTYLWSNGATTPSIVVNPQETTTYYLTITQDGVEYFDSLVVTVTPPPVVAINGNSSVCLGFSTTLQASPGVTFLWSTGDTTASITVSPSVNTTYSVEITDANGCTGTAEINVIVNQPSAISETASACNSYNWNGNTYTQSGTYTWTGMNAAGCDSVVTLNLTVSPTVTASEYISICDAELPYSWNGNTYTAAGSYSVTLNSTAGCDSVVTLNLSVSPSFTATDVQTACGSYTWIDGITYTFSTNTPTFTIAGGSVVAGCDSIISLDLTINNSVSATDVQSACGSFTWIDGVTYTSSTNTPTFTIPGVTIYGCDSVVTLNLTINQPSSETVNATITEGESYSFNGQNLTNAGTYTATLQNAAGCDSVVTLNLEVNQLPTTCSINASETEICLADSVTLAAIDNGFAPCAGNSNNENQWELLFPSTSFNGNEINFDPAGFDKTNSKLYSVLKTGSINRVYCFDLNTNQVIDIPSNGGPGELYEAVYDFSNQRLVANRVGRDAVYALPLAGGTWSQIGSGSFDAESYGANTFWNPITQRFSYFGGYGFFAMKNWIWENNGSGWQNIYSNNSNCTPGKRGGQISFNATGDKIQVFSGQGSCDGNQFASSCSLGSPWATDVGVYCWFRDLWELDLNTLQFNNILPTNSQSISQEGAFAYDYENDDYYIIGGFVPTGNYSTNVNEYGNSWTNQVLRFKRGEESGFSALTTGGANPPVSNNATGYGTAIYDANYDRIILARKDGIWALNLSTCEKNYAWSTGETTPSITVSPTETTTYSVTVTQGNQTCTSDVTITVNQPSAISETASACNSYNWNGTTYTQSGTYTWTGTNAAGCDSVVTLNLTITPQPEQPQLTCWQTATFDAASCSWIISGTQPTEPTDLACWETATFNTALCAWEVSGTQPEQPTNLACYETALFVDTLCNWVVTGTPAPAIVTNASACVSYTWEANGETYNTSGQYSFNSNCQEFVLNLTIDGQPEQPQLTCWQTATFDAASCSWIISGTQPTEPTDLTCWETATFNANTCNWVVTGTQPEQPTNLACYETALFVDTLCNWVVTGTPAPAIVTNASACVSYTWEANGETYNTSGQYSFNSNCQEFVLNLTINQESTSTVNATITEGESYSFVGQDLTATGTYTATLQNAAGCDSLVTLNLTVEPAVEPLNCEIVASDAQICLGESSFLNIEVATSNTACASENLPSNLQEGLVAWFPFCGNAQDASGNGHDGVVFGADLSPDRFGNPNSAYLFNGTSDYIISNAIPELNGAFEYSYGAWVKHIGDYSDPNCASGCVQFIVSRGWDFTSGNFRLLFTQPAQFGVDGYKWGTMANALIGGALSNEQAPIPQSDWSFVIAVKRNNQLNLYVNGVLDSSFPLQGALGTNNSPLIIGKHILDPNGNFPYFMNGFIDDVVVFNRALSDLEVNQLMNYQSSNSSILWSTGETTPSISVSPTETSTYSVTVTQGNQTCTSDVTITVNQSSAETVNATITEGETYSFNGQNLTTAGTYTATLQNAAGCDSVVTLNLTVIPAPVGGCYASSVVSFVQGSRRDGTPVTAVRSDSNQALGMPEPVVNNVVNFVSLGFGGSLTLAFETPIANGPGADIRIDEATWGNKTCNNYPESADVFASQDGVNFVYVGAACHDAEFDLAGLSWAQYIRIVDASNPLSFTADADGFDVNGVSCLNGAATSFDNDGLVACSLQEIIAYQPGNRKNGSAIPAARRNSNNALGMPQNNNTINFVALGFGGSLVAKFDYVVFNQDGNDIRVVETSYGNPSCNNYPERALVSVSMDNVSWTELGEICQDGEFDLGAVPYAQFIKIEDVSPVGSNKFNGSADGFDVDAVLVMNNGCGMNTARVAGLDNTKTPDSDMSMRAYPNPIEDYTIIRFEGLEKEETFKLEIFDASGRLVRSENIIVSVSDSEYFLPAQELARGIYRMVVSNETGFFTEQLVK